MSSSNLFYMLGPFLSLQGRVGSRLRPGRLAPDPGLWGPSGLPTSAPTPFILLDLGARLGFPPGIHPWTLLLSLSSDLCYAKFQQGDLEKTRHWLSDSPFRAVGGGSFLQGGPPSARLCTANLWRCQGLGRRAHCAGRRADPAASSV